MFTSGPKRVGALRPMEASDLDAVMEVERQSYSHPWTRQIFVDCLQVGYGCIVYEEQGELLAYGVLSAAAGEAHVLNVCVRPQSQGQGLGRYMLFHLADLAIKAKAECLFLEVRDSNVVAQSLYQSVGFNQLGIRAGYYPLEGGREDAVVFALDLTLDLDCEDEGRG